MCEQLYPFFFLFKFLKFHQNWPPVKQESPPILVEQFSSTLIYPEPWTMMLNLSHHIRPGVASCSLTDASQQLLKANFLEDSTVLGTMSSSNWIFFFFLGGGEHKLTNDLNYCNPTSTVICLLWAILRLISSPIQNSHPSLYLPYIWTHSLTMAHLSCLSLHWLSDSPGAICFSFSAS